MHKKPRSNNYTASQDDVLRELPKACSDERAAVEFFEAQRWPNGAFCARCASVDVYPMMGRKTSERQANYRWRCRDCNKQFTVRAGTIMEESLVPLTVWACAFWQACAGKKGVSAKQLERQTGVSYKTALYILHRIRWAMVETCGEPLTGAVEVDETHVGADAAGALAFVLLDHRHDSGVHAAPKAARTVNRPALRLRPLALGAW
jgi:transposase-like protein